jgi:hypothetical protein
MLNKTTSRKFIAPRRQERKERNISPNLAGFASLREAFLFRFCSQIQEKISNIFG